APVTPPTPGPDNDRLRELEGIAKIEQRARDNEQRARETLRQAEARRAEWEAAAEKRAAERILATYRKDPAAFHKEHGFTDRETLALAQRSAAHLVDPSALTPEIKAEIERNELLGRIERLENAGKDREQRDQEWLREQQDLQTGHAVLSEAGDDVQYARAALQVRQEETSRVR